MNRTYFNSKIGSVMRDNMYKRITSNHRTGKLENRTLYKVMTGSTKVFSREEEKKNRHYNVYIVFDESGSMQESMTGGSVDGRVRVDPTGKTVNTNGGTSNGSVNMNTCASQAPQPPQQNTDPFANGIPAFVFAPVSLPADQEAVRALAVQYGYISPWGHDPQTGGLIYALNPKMAGKPIVQDLKLPAGFNPNTNTQSAQVASNMGVAANSAPQSVGAGQAQQVKISYVDLLDYYRGNPKEPAHEGDGLMKVEAVAEFSNILISAFRKNNIDFFAVPFASYSKIMEVKPEQESYEIRNKIMVSALEQRLGGGTNMYEAFDIVIPRLRRAASSENIVIIMSDGDTGDNGTLRKQIRAMNDMANVIPVTIGTGGSMEYYFPSVMEADNYEMFMNGMLSRVSRLIKRG